MSNSKSSKNSKRKQSNANPINSMFGPTLHGMSPWNNRLRRMNTPTVPPLTHQTNTNHINGFFIASDSLRPTSAPIQMPSVAQTLRPTSAPIQMPSVAHTMRPISAPIIADLPYMTAPMPMPLPMHIPPITQRKKPKKSKKKALKPPPNSQTFENLPPHILAAMSGGQDSFAAAIADYNLPPTTTGNNRSYLSVTDITNQIVAYKYKDNSGFTNAEYDDMILSIQSLMAKGIKTGKYFWSKMPGLMQSSRTANSYRSRFTALSKADNKAGYRNAEFLVLKKQLDGFKSETNVTSKMSLLHKITEKHEKRRLKREKSKNQRELDAQKQTDNLQQMTDYCMEEITSKKKKEKGIKVVRLALDEFSDAVSEGKVETMMGKRELLELRKHTYTNPEAVISEFERVSEKMDTGKAWEAILELLRLL